MDVLGPSATANSNALHHRQRKARFDFVQVLNIGSTATVYKAMELETNNYYAVKVMQRTEANTRIIRREVVVQQNFNHKNIAKAYEFIETDSHFFLIQELLSGGDLFDAIATGNKINEATIMHWMRGVLEGLAYLHEKKHMAHRDIKLENTVRVAPGSNEVKLVDFGFTCQLTEVSDTIPGTEEYVSPELLAGKTNCCLKKADVWAAGILLWALLCSQTNYEFPWKRADNTSDSFCRFKRRDMSFGPWRQFSVYGRFLLLHMLAINPAERCTAAQALRFINEHWPVVIPTVVGVSIIKTPCCTSASSSDATSDTSLKRFHSPTSCETITNSSTEAMKSNAHVSVRIKLSNNEN